MQESCGGWLYPGSTQLLQSRRIHRRPSTKFVLVASSKLVEISEGSLCFTVQADTPSALKELWDIYKNGALQNRLQEFLVTEEIKQLASGEDIEVTVYMDEQEYKQAYLDLMLLENQGTVTMPVCGYIKS
ncbi:CCR4-NOT transcription complex subunit 6-like [Desmophyllum pertusum]|uniref:CCR4-NOT transcription complex subunit 6-like n=1 Tax=Desmophyllum pertusum TaxID=174260 RepID=A0A9W9ZD62_9CNID|nr:CCR4-NOT transcription complex subunit 6-like [Desmophyllum pertusum]